MSFLNPLGFFLLLLVPALILLYFLKLKRPQITVPSTLLWQKVIEDMRVNSPFQRLKRSLLLLLQLLTLLAAIAAIARPLFRVPDSNRESFIFILDNSASMGAMEPGNRSRLDLARTAILRILDRLPGEEEAMLIVYNARARIAADFNASRRAFRDSLTAVSTTDCATDLEPALLLARSVGNTRSRPRILLFSDGAFPMPSKMDLPAAVEFQKIGAPQPNLAVTGLDIRRSLADRRKIEAFVAVENFSDAPFTGNMTLQLDEQVLDVKPISVGPRETLSQIFEAELPQGGVIRVNLDTGDALRADDQAWKVVFPPIQRRVLIVGENPFFIERVFRATPGAECRTVSAADYSPAMAAGYPVVVWNNVSQPAVSDGYNIYFGCLPPVDGLAAGATIESPDILDWDTAHPVNRFLDFDSLLLMSTATLTLPESARVLLRSTRTPLIALVETGRGQACVTGFNPMQSNWPLMVSFPLFLNNCLDYFENQQQRRLEHNTTTGKAITLPAELATGTIRLPSGEPQPLSRTSRGDWSFTATDRAGAYRVPGPAGDSTAIAVNLFNRGESALDPVETPIIGGQKVKTLEATRQVNREYWRFLAIAFAALLLLEWVVYHRRIFV